MVRLPTVTDISLAGEPVKIVPGNPRYAISQTGNLWARKGRVQGSRRGLWNEWVRVSPWIGRDGYWYIKLSQKNSLVTHALHLLVLKTWIGNPKPGEQARHLDGNRQNAKLSNLAWGTRTENELDKRGHGTDNRGEKHCFAKMTNKEVDLARRLRKRYPGKSGIVGFLARWFGTSGGEMSEILNGKYYVENLLRN